jgi:hypothetical protein
VYHHIHHRQVKPFFKISLTLAMPWAHRHDDLIIETFSPTAAAFGASFKTGEPRLIGVGIAQ